MPDTPRSAFPVISENAVLRFRVGLFVSILLTVAAGAAWATNVQNKLEMLDQRLSRIEAALGVASNHTASAGHSSGAQP